MKILYTTLVNPSDRSSPSQHIINIISNWEKQGHTVRLLHPLNTIGRPYKELKEVTKNALIWERLQKDWSFCVHIIKELKTHDYDLVYHRYAFSSIFPVIVTKLKGFPLVMEINADLAADLERHWGGSPLMVVLIKLSAVMQYLLADQIIAVSEGIGERLRNNLLVNNSKVAVVPNGADLEIFQPISKHTSRKDLGIEQDEYVVVFTGSFQKYQGVEIIIDAARLLKIDNFSVKIFLVGEGVEVNYLKNKVKNLRLTNSIEFPGWCSPEITARFLGASDICLAPYTRDALLDSSKKDTLGALMKGSPLKIYTYLAAGRPVIASHFSEAGLFIEKYQAGIAIEPDNPSALAREINRLLADPSKMERMGENARHAAETDLGWDQTAEKIATICHKVINDQ